MEATNGRAQSLYTAAGRSLRLLTCLVAAAGCKSPGFLTQSKLMTDLGATGNADVRDALQSYFGKDATQHCDSSGSGLRVLFSGFSIFQDFPYNISGTVVQAMANPDLWPDTVDLDHFDPTLTTSLGPTSLLAAQDHGGKASQRHLTINGTPVTVCFVLLEVVWDQAAGILLGEASRFHPNAVIMTGGGVTDVPMVGQFEAGALNRAFALTGYGTDGKPIGDDLPVASSPGGDEAPILPPEQPGVLPTIAMRWDGAALATLTRPYARTIRRGTATNLFDVVAEPQARPSNTYLCNNISYVVLHALRGVPINLAGGLVRAAVASDSRPFWRDGSVLDLNLDAGLAAVATAGFFHIPDTATDEAQTMLGWARLFARVMVSGGA